MSGMLYAPNSTMIMSGGATLSSGGGCFMLVADTISMKGGSAGATICPGMGGGSSAEAILLQQGDHDEAPFHTAAQLGRPRHRHPRATPPAPPVGTARARPSPSPRPPHPPTPHHPPPP